MTVDMSDREQPYLSEDYDDNSDIEVLVWPDGSPAPHAARVTFRNLSKRLADELIDRFKASRESDRRWASMQRRKEQHRNDTIRRAALRLQLDAVWFTSTGEQVAVSNMTPRHASSSLSMLLNDFGRWIGDPTITYDNLGLPYRLEDTPIVKALRKRSKVKETKRHRALDEVSDTVFRAARAGGRVNLWETIESFQNTHSL